MFCNGVFPATLKTLQVHSKPKKSELDIDMFARYRPIENIPFLSRVIEKAAAIQVYNYLNCNNLFPTLQSAYRKHHSTETTFLSVSNDILKTLDFHGKVILLLLDLSMVFDTLDHHILLKRLHAYFNITETALQWFSLYLLDQSQRVTVDAFASSPCCLEYGVPQGSILSPLLFT